MNLFRTVALLALTLLSAACADQGRPTRLPLGQGAYQVMEPSAEKESERGYRIGALDTLDITVFQEPDLSVKALPVDAAGKISLPLIGTVSAAGMTASELSQLLAARFGEKFLVDPQVTVAVASSVSQKVIVQGEVTQPGVYEIRGRATLLEALSQAKGETRTSALNRVTVLRTIDGQRMGAVFDVHAIRRGDAADPIVLGNDTVIVGYSPARGAWRDMLQAAPILTLFRPLW